MLLNKCERRKKNMTENSIICNFINDNGDSWREVLCEQYPSVKMKEEYPLAIFNYGIEADFADPLIQEARGIIINVKTKDVVCFPFRKFGKWDEYYADTIDWSSARVQEKLDGSIIKLWWNDITKEWQFSTNSTINAKDAHIHLDDDTNFLDIIKMAVNYGDIPFETLDKTCTYIFELESPYTKVVIPHTITKLIHIGTRSNITGKEFSVDIGIEKPEEYSLGSLEQCLQAIDSFCTKNGKDGKISGIEHEGFVVVDKYYNRIKIKGRIYMILHSLTECPKRTKDILIEMLWNNEISIIGMISQVPEYSTLIKYYDFKLDELRTNAANIVHFARRIYKMSDNNRKEVALNIKDCELSAVGFRSLDNCMTSDDILLQFGFSQIAKLIPTYQPLEFIYKHN